MQICDPVLRYRKSGFFYNGRIFRGKSFCLVNNKKLTKITGGIISLRFYLKVKCNEQGEKEMKRKIVIGMLVLSMAVSATACSSKKEETAKAGGFFRRKKCIWSDRRGDRKACRAGEREGKDIVSE